MTRMSSQLQAALWRANNREKWLAYLRDYRAKNKERIKAQHDKWMLENPALNALQKRRWNSENKTNRLAYQRKRYAIPQIREAELERAKKFKAADPELFKAVHRKTFLKTTYGLSVEAWNEMLARQDGRCAICRKVPSGSRRPHVDHCHATGEIRGILCHKCNLMIGPAGDSEEILEAAIKYLKGK